MKQDKPTICPLIDLRGSAAERGLSYGRQATRRIGLGIEHYTKQIRDVGVDLNLLNSIIDGFVPIIKKFDEDFIEEMRGIAEGASVDFRDIILLNARTEILKLAASKDLRESLINQSIEPDGCTGVVVMPNASKDGHLIHAQTWDWKAECAETVVMLRIQQEDGPEILTFTEAGGLARSGMNSAGICLSANYLECDRDYKSVGIPLSIIRRKILQTDHLSLAFHAAYSTAKTASNNVIISHKEGIAINFECAPDETFQILPRDELIVHANHWQSPIALSKLKENGVTSFPDSLYRDIRVRQALEQHIWSIDASIVKEVLADKFGAPWGVCRPPHISIRNNLSATVATLIMEPELGCISVAILPAQGGEFVTYGFKSQQDVNGGGAL